MWMLDDSASREDARGGGALPASANAPPPHVTATQPANGRERMRISNVAAVVGG